MTEFFIPFASGPAEAEQLWQATKAFMEDPHGWTGITERRVFRLGYLHDGKHLEAEVGKPHPYAKAIDWEAFEEVGEEEEVLVILEREGGPFLVCSANRGVARGEPILVGTGEPYEVVYFDGHDDLGLE